MCFTNYVEGRGTPVGVKEEGRGGQRSEVKNLKASIVKKVFNKFIKIFFVYCKIIYSCKKV